MITKQKLIEFEEDISEIYKTGVIKGPIHLRGGNEEPLIEIFKDIRPTDIVLATWANHLEALLKGVPKEKVKERILAGHSMAMNFPDHNFYTSAIVNGISPIGVGMAWAAKKKHTGQQVYIFIGDMAFQSGDTIECIRYSINFDLPISWIISDNGISVDTPTWDAWHGDIRKLYNNLNHEASRCLYTELKMYSYKNKWPHSGVGTFVSF